MYVDCKLWYIHTVLSRLIPTGNYFSLPPFEGDLFEGELLFSRCQRAVRTGLRAPFVGIFAHVLTEIAAKFKGSL